MAFVYRNQNQRKISESPGPGTYENSCLVENKKALTVSFNDKQNRQLWKVKEGPGPGDYKIPNSFNKSNIILNDDEENFMILQMQQSSAFFKSKCKRCTYQKLSETPGPGNYQTDQGKKGKANDKVNKPTKLMKYLYKQNIKKVAPSIPEQCCWRDEQIPEKTPTKKKEKEKKTNAFASKVERNILERPKTSIGPGSYNITTSGFHKKEYNLSNTGKTSMYLSSKPKKENEKTFEKISQLGPGYYEVKNETFNKKVESQSKGIACFGSKQTRFYKPNNYSSTQIGPTSYGSEMQKQAKSESKKKSKIAFNTSEVKKFFMLNNENKNVSPLTYNPQNDFQANMKKKFAKGLVGFFGTTAQRFPKQKQFKTPESSEEKHDFSEAKRKFEKLKKKRKHQNEIKLIPKQETDNRPLCYDNNHKTIKNEYSNKEQINAPFFTCAERFLPLKEKKNILAQLQMQRIKIQSQTKKTGKQKKKSMSSSVVKLYISELRKKKKQGGENLIDSQMNDTGGNKQNSPANNRIKKSFNKLFPDTILI